MTCSLLDITAINAAGVWFKVEFVSGGLHYNDQEVFGLCIKSDKLIQISSDEDEEAIKSTLVHEYLHAILYVTGRSERLSDRAEEELVLLLEHQIAPFFEFSPSNDKLRWKLHKNDMQY